MLVVLAIALGISAFAAVLSSYAILTRELDQGISPLIPLRQLLRVDSIDDELVKAILAESRSERRGTAPHDQRADQGWSSAVAKSDPVCGP